MSEMSAPMRQESMIKIACYHAECTHPALSADTLRVCREIARGVADYQRDTSGHEQRDYAAIQDREERYWHARAVRCKADHGAYDIAHPGCQLCPSVHGLPYEMIR